MGWEEDGGGGEWEKGVRGWVSLFGAFVCLAFGCLACIAGDITHSFMVIIYFVLVGAPTPHWRLPGALIMMLRNSRAVRWSLKDWDT